MAILYAIRSTTGRSSPDNLTLPQGKYLLSGEVVLRNGTVSLPARGVAVIEEGAR